MADIDNSTYQDFQIIIDKKDVKQNKKTLKFDIKGNKEYGLSKSLINGIRRTLLTDIDTVAIDVKDINIITNNGKLHNEFLKDRISLIPLYINPETYHRNLLFKLHVKVTDTQVLNITADMFDIYPLKEKYELMIEEQANKEVPIEDNIYTKIETMSTEFYDMDNPISNEKKANIFRPFIFKNNDPSYYLITELRNTNSTEVNEEIELYCCPTIGVSKDHARWNNIPLAVYTFKKDPELFEKVMNEKMTLEKVKNKEVYIEEHKISEGERYFHKDNQLEPYWYDFSIQSNHIYTPKELLLLSIDRLMYKFNNIEKRLLVLKNKAMKPNDDEEEDNSIEDGYKFTKLKVDNTYSLFMVDENDTAGNIIQSHAVDKFITDTSYVTFCGYKKAHPLINEINFSFLVSPSDNNEQQKKIYIISFLINVVKDINQIFNKIKEEAELNI
jgi:DNA-directed RNA polymerase subunit L